MTLQGIAEQNFFAQHGGLDKLRGKRILLVDDIKINSLLAKKILETAGCHVDIVNNGLEAVRAFLHTAHFYYDAILIDVIMPVMDGLEAVRKIRAVARPDAKSMPIIAITSITGTVMLHAILSAGMNARLVKPIDPILLCDTIIHFLAVTEEKRRAEMEYAGL
ncbi:MAG: response regulator [Eubacteriales bacterium]|nr:response regulator [Eubacteriales bacterium]